LCTLLSVAALAGCASASQPAAAPAPSSGSAASTVAQDASNGPTAAEQQPTGAQQIATDEGTWGITGDPPAVTARQYAEVVNRVASMVTDRSLQRAVGRRGLHLVNVTWEDTGRAEGSVLGPNISDLTLQVRRRDVGRNGYTEALMPVIRFPNFTDRTGDIPSNKFLVRVGNEKSGQLRSVPLTSVLRNLRSYVSDPASVPGGSLLAARDSHFLVSAQAVFLPIPKSGKAEFNPVIFNYQSAPGSPAVLTLLVTRQGTSIKVIENVGEDATYGGGQELYFNNVGQRAAFTAERKSDVEARIEAQGGPRTQDDKSALAKGADCLFLIQVPLKHKNRGYLGGVVEEAEMPTMADGAGAAPMKSAARSSDVEQAVLGHGPNLGPYHEGTGVRLVRDPKFPIRVTVQFYKATSNGVVSESDLDLVAKNIGSVYEHADYVGSLVIPEGDPRRPTAWQTIPNEWFPW
ncbi:MAG: hypothetical protein ACOC1F_00395, partial [Myxococcota bacterium]